jgi:large subunit ribosomal protein L30
MQKGVKVKVKQTRGLAGRSKDFRKIVTALGLGKIGAEREFTLNPALAGMIQKVEHIVNIEVVK